MENAKNDKQSAESSSKDQQRHKQAIDYMQELVGELLSSADESDSHGRAG